MSEKSSEIWTSILYVAGFALMINGCVHSCNKHKDDPIWLQETPAVMYRGAEYFWHDDFAGVDWTEKISDDISTTITLLDMSIGSDKIDDVKKQINDFSIKISTYPVDKKKSIERGVKKYLRFLENMSNDFYQYTLSLGQGSRFEFSENTKILYDSLSEYYKINGMGTLRKMLDSMAVKVSSDTSNAYVIRNRIKEHISYDHDIYGDTYFKIFKKKME